MRDRLSRSGRGTGDDGRTVLEAVVALSIIAASAAAWTQMTTVAARSAISAERHQAAVVLASSELEHLRVTPGVETGTGGIIGISQIDGLTVLADGSGPDHAETVTVDGHDFDIERYVLDPGSAGWRRLVVVVQWDDNGVARDVRVDTAIPVVPDATDPLSGSNLLVNGGFELTVGGPGIGGQSFSAVPGWTGSGGTIEVWGSGFNGVTAVEGDTFIEVNGSGPETISQAVAAVPGVTYRWSIDHRGRTDDDSLQVLIDGVVVSTFTTPPGAWVTYTGTHTATSTPLVLGFRAVDSGSIGNLIDNARFAVEAGV